MYKTGGCPFSFGQGASFRSPHGETKVLVSAINGMEVALFYF